MYVYFDSQGRLKEIINDVPLRKGSDNVNKVYCYFEGIDKSSSYFYVKRNGETTSIAQAGSYEENVYIDYEGRDLKYFKEETSYNMYSLTLTKEMLAIDGLLQITCELLSDSSTLATGLILTTIENNNVNITTEITESEYEMLKQLIASIQSLNDISVIGDTSLMVEGQETTYNEGIFILNYYNDTLSFFRVVNGKLTKLTSSSGGSGLNVATITITPFAQGEITTTILSEEDLAAINFNSSQVLRVQENGSTNYLYFFLNRERTSNNLFIWSCYKGNCNYILYIIKGESILNGRYYIFADQDQLSEIYLDLEATKEDLAGNYYNKTSIDNLLETLRKNTYQVVETLPDISEAKEGVIYLVPVESDTDNYTQYILENSKWLSLGNTKLDLTNYYTKSEIDTKESDLKADIETNSQNIENNTSSIKTLNTSLTNTNTKVDTLSSSITAIGNRTTLLENDLKVVNTSLSTINTTITTIQDKDTEQDNLLTTYANDIADLQSANGVQDTKIANNTSSINSLKTSKQDVLVSGESIKTINGASILGSGDIVVSADSTSVIIRRY